jgi:putative inorganic carbon (HCO3(-)) transporter
LSADFLRESQGEHEVILTPQSTYWFLDRLIRFGLILLLVWTPFAFGAVHAWAFGLLEVHVFVLIALWMLQLIISYWLPSAQHPGPPTFVWTPLAIPIALFLTWIALQLIPLPASFLATLSPATTDLYRLFLPTWPNTQATLSLYPHATRIALGQLLAYTGLFFLVVNTVRTHHTLRVICWAVVATAFSVALLGILQGLSGTSSIFWIRDTSYARNFFGPYVNRNHFAGYQVMAIPFALALLLAMPVQAKRERTPSWRHQLLRVFGLLSTERLLLVVALATMSAALFLSKSRGGALSFLMSLGLFGLLLRSRPSRMERQAVFGIAAAAVMGMAVWLGITPLLSRFEQLASDSQMLTLAERLPAFQAAWHMSQDFPVFGVGYDAYAVASPRYLPAETSQERFFHVHNDFLQLLAETGWIGFLLIVGGVLLMLRTVIARWRSRRDPTVSVMVPAGLAALCAIGLHSLVDFNLHIPANALLFAVVLALTYAAAHLPSRSDRTPQSAHSPSAWVATWPWFGLVAALWLGFGALRLTIADVSYPQQEVLQPTHWIYHADPELKRARLEQALRWTPNNPWYWSNLADLEVQVAWSLRMTDNPNQTSQTDAVVRFQHAVQFYERAIEQHPTEPYTQLAWLSAQQDLATIPGTSSLPGPKLAAHYQRLATLAPSSADIQYRLGELLLGAPPEDRADLQPATFFRRALERNASYDQEVLQAYLRHLPEAVALHEFARVLPNTAEGHLQAAKLMQEQHWRQARLHYRTALVLSDDNPELLQDILQAYGNALQRHEAYEDVKAIWQRLIEARPDDPKPYLRLAGAQSKLEDYKGLVGTLEQLVAKFPREVHYYAQLGNAYMRAGDIIAAETTWQRVTQLQPYSATGYVGLARLYEDRGDVPDALLLMQRAVSIEPDNPAYQRRLARLLESSGKNARARDVYQKLATDEVQDPYVFYKLGEYARQDGKPKHAVAYFQRAVQLQPDHAGFRQALQRAIEQSNAH